MNDDLELLSSASLDAPVADSIERIVDRDIVEWQTVVQRFLDSPRLENRHAALWALVYYGRRVDLEVQALCLHVSGALHDDDAAAFGAVSLIYEMKGAGNDVAARILEMLHLDSKWIERYEPTGRVNLDR